jgi:hypothetical protein
MKYYALLHGVCGLAEGYSDTTVRWFNDLDKALESKARLRATLMDDDNAESCTTTTDGMQSVINYDIDEREHEILKIIELKPTWPENKAISEYLVWDQVNCEAPFDGDYMPTEMAVVKDLCERQEAVADTFDVEAFHEFINDLWYGGAAMFDADDLCIYYFKMPKVYYPSQPVEFKS